MMKSRMTKKEQVRQREDGILQVARDLAAECGYLELKISDVAAKAKISIGTLYSHFESKEDLIVALANVSFCKRFECYDAMLNNGDMKLSERLLGVAFVDYLFSLDHPELFEAEQLSATTSVWQRASDLRNQAIVLPLRRICDLVGNACLQSINAGEFKAAKNTKEQADDLDFGLWALLTGAGCIAKFSTHLDGPCDPADPIPRWYVTNCLNLFTGFGWAAKRPHADAERIVKHCIRHGRYVEKTNNGSKARASRSYKTAAVVAHRPNGNRKKK